MRCLHFQKEQRRFAAPYSVSLAQAKGKPDCVPLAVYAGVRSIGFLYYKKHEYWIYRKMVEENYQSRG